MNKITGVSLTTLFTLLFLLAIFAKTGVSQSANDTTHFDLNVKITETTNKLDSLQDGFNKDLKKYNNTRALVEVAKSEIDVAAKKVEVANKDMQIFHDILKEAQTRQRNNYKISVEKERLQCLKASEECKKAEVLVQSKERDFVKAKEKVQEIYTKLEDVQREYNALGGQLVEKQFGAMEKEFTVKRWVENARGEANCEGKTNPDCVNEAIEKASEDAIRRGVAEIARSSTFRVNESIEYEIIISLAHGIVSRRKNEREDTIGRMIGFYYEMDALVEVSFPPEARKYIKSKKLYLPEQGPSEIKNDGPVPLKPRLRSKSVEFYSEDAIEMIDKYNFYDSYKNEAGDFENKFILKVINGKKVVIDHETKLMWHQSGTWKIKWRKAKRWIDNLNKKKYAGYGDWRLPTLEEAASLLERVEGATNIKELKGKLNKEGKKYKLFIDPVFSNTQKSIWTCDGPKSDQVFIVCFDLGLSGKCNLNQYSYVRPVRSVK